MNSKTAASHRWFAGWREHRRTPQHDPADFGTAFGLDMSLLEAADEAPAPPVVVSRRPGWVARLAARRRAGA